MGIELPDTNGLSVFQAALMYADSGIPIAPFDPYQDKGKSCGNLLGNKEFQELLGLPTGGKWYNHATTHLATLERWNSVLPNGFQAIATSPGRIGVVVLDIDNPAEFPIPHRCVAKATAHVLTKLEQRRRGHYWFNCTVPVNNSVAPWGEFRSFGGGVVLSPYPLDKRYVARPGHLLELPVDIANTCVYGESSVDWVEVEKFLARYKGNKYPHKLKGLEGLLHWHLDRTNVHDSFRFTLRTGFEEAIIGFIPAQAVYNLFEGLWPRVRGYGEFKRIIQWAVYAALASDCTSTEAMSRRARGTDSRDYAHLFT